MTSTNFNIDANKTGFLTCDFCAKSYYSRPSSKNSEGPSLDILDSNQPSATVTFVRVSGQTGNANEEAVDGAPVDAAVPEDPILMLDQDQITKLENVLRSEEAKDFLGEVLSNPGTNPNESLGDFLTPAVGPPPPLIPNDEVKEQLQEEQQSNTKSKSNRRKSQRQLDRELKEEAEKIRKENQKMLKKEKEAMRRQSRGGDITPPEEEKSESNDGKLSTKEDIM